MLAFPLYGMLIKFMQSSFVIYEGINGLATSYTISYSDSNNGQLCGSTSTSCVGGTCSGEFDVSSSSCRPSSNISVTVSVVTNLGKGPQTDPIVEGECIYNQM